VYFSKADTRTALITSLSPPAADKRAVEVSPIYVGSIVAAANQVTVSVVIVATSTSTAWFYEVTEAGPTDANAVRAFHYVEISIDAILYVTVIHPHIFCANQADIIAVVGVNIVGSWAA
jgi:hypothetical protein